MKKLNNKNVNKVLIILSVLLVIALMIGIVISFGKIIFHKQSKVEDLENTSVPERTYRTERYSGTNDKNQNENSSDTPKVTSDLFDSINSLSSSSSSSAKKREYMEDYAIIGKIKISKINLSYDILEKVTTHSLELSVGMLCGPGLNKPGNTVIMGHNYRNGTFFSNLYKLANGDIVEIEDLEGKTVKYEIYNIYETSADDTEYANRDTAGAREISLSSCNDDVSGRIIVWAKEK